ncbi:MAG: beta-ketoacyl synthase chain length factor [Nitrospiraceae bacterium]
MELNVSGASMLGAGLAGWARSRAVLAGESPLCDAAQPEPTASLLPPNEQRRSSESVRWALYVAQETLQQAETDVHEVASVFASSDSETGILDRLCTALATPPRTISPTLFHHSVHNAVSGYWGIATGSPQSSTALACYDSSFCAGLLEAAAQAELEERPVLLVAYDLLPPPPLYAARPFREGFAVALLLTRTSTPRTFARLDLVLSNDLTEEATSMDDARLEAIRSGNQAARSLPLLVAIARQRISQVRLEYLEDQHLVLQVMPC